KYIKRYRKEDTMQTASRVIAFMRANPHFDVNIDDSGVGGGVVDRINEELRKEEFAYYGTVTGINVGVGLPKESDFINLRGSYYWHLRTLLEQGKIKLPESETLAAELTAGKYGFSSGRIVIEKKEDMKKRGVKSPDGADALMLCFAPTQIMLPDMGKHEKREDEDEPRGRGITAGLRDKRF